VPATHKSKEVRLNTRDWTGPRLLCNSRDGRDFVTKCDTPSSTSTSMSSAVTTSKLRTSTPVRAIVSKIGSKSSPLIPPASQSYDPLVKSVLRHRLSHIFLYSALLSWLIGSSWTIWKLGGVGLSRVVIAPFSPLTLVSSLMTWLSTALPVIVLRKVFFTGE
jgi:nucleoporin NDC1